MAQALRFLEQAGGHLQVAAEVASRGTCRGQTAEHWSAERMATAIVYAAWDARWIEITKHTLHCDGVMMPHPVWAM